MTQKCFKRYSECIFDRGGGVVSQILKGEAPPINDRFPYPLIYLKPEKGIRLWRPPARKVKRACPPRALANFARYG